MQQARVARFWNMTLNQFRMLDGDEQAELHAVYVIEQQIEMYYSSEQAKRADELEHQSRQRR